jgi:hypothetical protein
MAWAICLVDSSLEAFHGHHQRVGEPGPEVRAYSGRVMGDEDDRFSVFSTAISGCT